VAPSTSISRGSVASQYDPGSAKTAASNGKTVWIYNGIRPQTDAFFTDTSAIALRANAWIAAMNGIRRWFYWETTFWYDSNRGGHGPYDPFTTAETFHNSDGDQCQGDGVLVYPGKQVDQFTDHSLGINGVVASIRLKNLRRGIEDAGYYQLAHAANAAQAEAIAGALLPTTLSSASDGRPVAWSEAGSPWFAARKQLAALVPQKADPVPAGDGGGATGEGGALQPGADAGVRLDGGSSATPGGGTGTNGEGPGASPGNQGNGGGGCAASGSRAPREPAGAAASGLAIAFAIASRVSRRIRRRA
jgi:hypothetical protein